MFRHTVASHALIASTLAIGACTAAGERPAASPTPPQQTCDAAALQGEIGRIVAQDFVEWARTTSGARSVRLIRPGMAVTMDYRPDRLNLTVDDAERLTRAQCG